MSGRAASLRLTVAAGDGDWVVRSVGVIRWRMSAQQKNAL